MIKLKRRGTMSGYTTIPNEGESTWSSGLCDCFSDCRFPVQILFFTKIFTGGSLLKGASLSRLCIVSVIPVVNVVSLGQTYTVADKKTGISEDIICGAIIPLVGLY